MRLKQNRKRVAMRWSTLLGSYAAPGLCGFQGFNAQHWHRKGQGSSPCCERVQPIFEEFEHILDPGWRTEVNPVREKGQSNKVVTKER